MKWMVSIVAAAAFAGTAKAASVSDALQSLITGTVDRFETASLSCPNAATPNLSPFVQYRTDGTGGWQRIVAGRARQEAPFIWLSHADGRLVVSIASMVRGDWIYCDDDGDEWERSKDYWFDSRYQVTDTPAGMRLTLAGFLRLSHQGFGVLPLPGTLLQPVDLLDGYFVYSDPAVNGPAEHFTCMTPQSLEMKVTPAGNGFAVEFPDACGPGVPLTANYRRSDCQGGWGCSQFPAAMDID
jgi:hypothetical protein